MWFHQLFSLAHCVLIRDIDAAIAQSRLLSALISDKLILINYFDRPIHRRVIRVGFHKMTLPNCRNGLTVNNTSRRNRD